MAAPKENKNAAGKHRTVLKADKVLAGEVRSLALTEIKKYLLGEEDGYRDKEMKKQIILKLAPSLLPRLNEHTGEDGKDLFPTPILANMNGLPTNLSNKESSESSE